MLYRVCFSFRKKPEIGFIFFCVVAEIRPPFRSRKRKNIVRVHHQNNECNIFESGDRFFGGWPRMEENDPFVLIIAQVSYFCRRRGLSILIHCFNEQPLRLIGQPRSELAIYSDYHQVMTRARDVGFLLSIIFIITIEWDNNQYLQRVAGLKYPLRGFIDLHGLGLGYHWSILSAVFFSSLFVCLTVSTDSFSFFVWRGRRKRRLHFFVDRQVITLRAAPAAIGWLFPA